MKKNYKLTDKELKIINKASDITRTDYEIYDNQIEVYLFVVAVEELINTVEHYKQEIRELKQDPDDNYIRRPMSDYTGDSYDDRY